MISDIILSIKSSQMLRAKESANKFDLIDDVGSPVPVCQDWAGIRESHLADVKVIPMKQLVCTLVALSCLCVSNLSLANTAQSVEGASETIDCGMLAKRTTEMYEPLTAGPWRLDKVYCVEDFPGTAPPVMSPDGTKYLLVGRAAGASTVRWARTECRSIWQTGYLLPNSVMWMRMRSDGR